MAILNAHMTDFVDLSALVTFQQAELEDCITTGNWERAGALSATLRNNVGRLTQVTMKIDKIVQMKKGMLG